MSGLGLPMTRRLPHQRLQEPPSEFRATEGIFAGARFSAIRQAFENRWKKRKVHAMTGVNLTSIRFLIAGCIATAVHLSGMGVMPYFDWQSRIIREVLKAADS